MKKIISTSFVIYLIFTTSITPAFAKEKIDFKDVPKSYWAYGTINEMTNNGYFKGYPTGKFLPNNSISRAEFISLFDNIVKKNFTILKSDEDIKLLSKLPEYKDVPKNHWAYNSIKNLWFYGRVFNKSDLTTRNNTDLIFGKDNLNPNQPITRAEASEILCKMINYNDVNSNLPTQFKDCKNHKFEASIKILNTLGVINGYPDNTFKPNQGIKRSEATKMIKNLLDIKPCFKKVIWTSDSGYTYDHNLSSPIDVVKEVLKLELEGKLNQSYIYYSDSTKNSLGLSNYKDYMTNNNIHISKNISHFSWERVNKWTNYIEVSKSDKMVIINYKYTLQDESIIEDNITLENQNGKWFVVCKKN